MHMFDMSIQVGMASEWLLLATLVETSIFSGSAGLHTLAFMSANQAHEAWTEMVSFRTYLIAWSRIVPYLVPDIHQCSEEYLPVLNWYCTNPDLARLSMAVVWNNYWNMSACNCHIQSCCPPLWD